MRGFALPILIVFLGLTYFVYTSALDRGPVPQPEVEDPSTDAGDRDQGDEEKLDAEAMRAKKTPVVKKAPAQAPESKKAAQPAASTTPLARQLGLSDVDAEAMKQWYAGASTTQSQLFNELEDGAGPAGGKSFNEAMDKLRAQLLQRYGVDAANRALQEFPIYRFDLRGGFIIQVDAQGAKLPFKDPQMANVWNNFTKQ